MSKRAVANGRRSRLARTGVVSGRPACTNASASSEMSTPTTRPCLASQAPLPPGPQPASRISRSSPSQGSRRSFMTARVLRYHQWWSSAAAIRAYSSISTDEEGTGCAQPGQAPPEPGSGRQEEAVHRHFGRRPRLDPDARSAARLATGVDRAPAELVHRQHDLAVDARGELVGAQLD